MKSLRNNPLWVLLLSLAFVPVFTFPFLSTSGPGAFVVVLSGLIFIGLSCLPVVLFNVPSREQADIRKVLGTGVYALGWFIFIWTLNSANGNTDLSEGWTKNLPTRFLLTGAIIAHIPVGILFLGWIINKLENEENRGVSFFGQTPSALVGGLFSGVLLWWVAPPLLYFFLHIILLIPKPVMTPFSIDAILVVSMCMGVAGTLLYFLAEEGRYPQTRQTPVVGSQEPVYSIHRRKT
jgi:hypothetical protein